MYPYSFYQVYLVTFGLLLILLISAFSEHEPHFLQHRLFRDMVISTMVCTGLEFLTWIWDGRSGTAAFLLTRITNTLLFVVNILPLILWILYVEFQIDQERERLPRVGAILGGIFIVNSALAVSSLKTGFFFYFDASNTYHRGPLHWVAVSVYLCLLAYVVILPIVRRRVLPSRLRWPLVLFSIPSVIGVSAQMLVYGLNLSWAGAALSLLIIYTNIQNRILSTDYLTGLYNRRQLDLFLRHRIKTFRPYDKLALFMLDIDKFKDINDTYGHPVGDMALECTAALLRKIFHHHDFISRYAGDEFAVVLELSHPEDIASIEARVQEKFEAFNREAAYPFKLSVSVGSAVYDAETCNNAAVLLARADRCMYEMKVKRRAAEIAET
jgi:diguanylate cyclase (GGDEF)-like protein